MGQTIAQKIISRVAGRETVEPGEFVMVSPDYTVGCEMYWPMHAQHMRDMGIDKFANADKVVMVIDHTTYTSTGSIYGELQADMREFAKRTGIRLDRSFDCHQVFLALRAPLLLRESAVHHATANKGQIQRGTK